MVRAHLIERQRRLLAYADGVGDEPAAGRFRDAIAHLEAGGAHVCPVWALPFELHTAFGDSSMLVELGTDNKVRPAEAPPHQPHACPAVGHAVHRRDLANRRPSVAGAATTEGKD